jgi:hypothetical protein
MSSIPEELQRLWASRDRAPSVEVIPTITLEDSDDLPIVTLDFLEEEDATISGTNASDTSDASEPSNISVSPITPTYSVTESVTLFPTYKVGVPSINIGKYESAYDKRIRRNETT